jgi:hypothetical protein
MVSRAQKYPGHGALHGTERGSFHMTGSKTDGIIGHYLAGQQSILEKEKVGTFSSADFSTANAWPFSDGI